MDHPFTQRIKTILEAYFGTAASDIYDKSLLLQYLNIKTRSATGGSKTRSSFGNIYVIYVLVEDYLRHNFDQIEEYFIYENVPKNNTLLKQWLNDICVVLKKLSTLRNSKTGFV